MTSNEITLLAEILKLHTEAAINNAITPLKEELKKIKALNAQILKEGRQAPQAVAQPQQATQKLTLLGKPLSYRDEDMIVEHAGSNPMTSIYEDPSLKAMAVHAAQSGGLPDIDLPIPSLFNK